MKPPPPPLPSRRDTPLPSVRHLDSEQDIYGVEMLRRLLMEAKTSTPLLRSLRDEVLDKADEFEVWLGRQGISPDSPLASNLHDTLAFWRKDLQQSEGESPVPFWPTVFVPLEEITLTTGWDRTRERWEDFERRARRQTKIALDGFLKQYKAEVMRETARVRRYDSASIRWLVCKAWGFDEDGRPYSYAAVAKGAGVSTKTAERAVKRLADYYGITLVRRSVGRPPGAKTR